MSSMWGWGWWSGSKTAETRELALSETTAPSAAFNQTIDVTNVHLKRLFICGLPHNGPTINDAKTRRNNSQRLAAYLDTAHGEGSYLIINLAPDEGRLSYDPSIFKSQVLLWQPSKDVEEYRQLYDESLPLITDDLYPICYVIEFWLRAHPKHVVVLHDTDGRKRSAVAAAAYLAWRHPGEFDTIDNALDHVLRLRTSGGAAAVKPPQLQNLLHNFMTTMQLTLPSRPAPPKRMILVKATAHMENLSLEEEYVHLIVYHNGVNRLWSSESDAVENKFFVCSDGQLVATTQCAIIGDVTIVIYYRMPKSHHGSGSGSASASAGTISVGSPNSDTPATKMEYERRMIARYTFQTNCLPAGVVTLHSALVDVCDPPVFAKEHFKMHLILKDPAAPDSPLAVPTPAQRDEAGNVVSQPRWPEGMRQVHALSSASSHSSASSLSDSSSSVMIVNNSGGALGATDAADGSPSAPSASFVPARRPGEGEWDFARLLNLAPRGSHCVLAGLFHWSMRHCVLPEPALLALLLKEGHDVLFASAAIRVAARDAETAESVLHSVFWRAMAEFYRRLQPCVDTAMHREVFTDFRPLDRGGDPAGLLTDADGLSADIPLTSDAAPSSSSAAFKRRSADLDKLMTSPGYRPRQLFGPAFPSSSRHKHSRSSGGDSWMHVGSDDGVHFGPSSASRQPQRPQPESSVIDELTIPAISTAMAAKVTLSRAAKRKREDTERKAAAAGVKVPPAAAYVDTTTVAGSINSMLSPGSGALSPSDSRMQLQQHEAIQGFLDESVPTMAAILERVLEQQQQQRSPSPPPSSSSYAAAAGAPFTSLSVTPSSVARSAKTPGYSHRKRRQQPPQLIEPLDEEADYDTSSDIDDGGSAVVTEYEGGGSSAVAVEASNVDSNSAVASGPGRPAAAAAAGGDSEELAGTSFTTTPLRRGGSIGDPASADAAGAGSMSTPGGIGPARTPSLSISAYAEEALRPIIAAIQQSPDPSLYLAGLQLATAAKLAEKNVLTGKFSPRHRTASAFTASGVSGSAPDFPASASASAPAGPAASGVGQRRPDVTSLSALPLPAGSSGSNSSASGGTASSTPAGKPRSLEAALDRAFDGSSTPNSSAHASATGSAEFADVSLRSSPTSTGALGASCSTAQSDVIAASAVSCADPGLAGSGDRPPSGLTALATPYVGTVSSGFSQESGAMTPLDVRKWKESLTSLDVFSIAILLDALVQLGHTADVLQRATAEQAAQIALVAASTPAPGAAPSTPMSLESLSSSSSSVSGVHSFTDVSAPAPPAGGVGKGGKLDVNSLASVLSAARKDQPMPPIAPPPSATASGAAAAAQPSSWLGSMLSAFTVSQSLPATTQQNTTTPSAGAAVGASTPVILASLVPGEGPALSGSPSPTELDLAERQRAASVQTIAAVLSKDPALMPILDVLVQEVQPYMHLAASNARTASASPFPGGNPSAVAAQNAAASAVLARRAAAAAGGGSGTVGGTSTPVTPTLTTARGLVNLVSSAFTVSNQHDRTGDLPPGFPPAAAAAGGAGAPASGFSKGGSDGSGTAAGGSVPGIRSVGSWDVVLSGSGGRDGAGDALSGGTSTGIGADDVGTSPLAAVGGSPSIADVMAKRRSLGSSGRGLLGSSAGSSRGVLGTSPGLPASVVSAAAAAAAAAGMAPYADVASAVGSTPAAVGELVSAQTTGSVQPVASASTASSVSAGRDLLSPSSGSEEGKPTAHAVPTPTPAPETVGPAAVAPAAEVAPPHAPAAASAAGPDLSKYHKMLKMGIPEGAVKQSMMRDGLYPGLLDGTAAAPPPQPPAEESSTPPATAAVDTSKYERMLKLGVPPGAVRQAMAKDGVDVSLLNDVLVKLGRAAEVEHEQQSSQSQPAPHKPKEAKQEQEEDEGASGGALSDAAAAAARAERIAFLRQQQKDMVAEASMPLNSHPVYSRYVQMVKVGVPREVVASKMATAGLDPLIISGEFDQPPNQPPLVPLKEDAIYGKYFRMTKVGLPRDVVEHKMRQDESGGDVRINPLALELDPDLPAPPGLAEDPALAAAGPRRPHGLPPPATVRKPRKQRKRLHWEALPADRIGGGGTIWDDLNSSLDSSAGAGLGAAAMMSPLAFADDVIDDAELEELFTLDPSLASAASSKKRGADADPSKTPGKVLYLVDSKRERNVGIGLLKLRLPNAAIRDCLLNLSCYSAISAVPGSGSGIELTSENLALLEDLLLDDREDSEHIARAKGFKGDKARLSEASLFWVTVADVPKARARASALSYQRSFDARVAETAARVDLLKRAVHQLRTSNRLKRLLVLVRQLVNKLNASDDDDSHSSHGRPGSAGSSAGSGIVAFKLDSLLKLNHTKSFDGKTTALRFLVRTIMRKEPDTLLLSDDMPDVTDAGRLTLESLAKDLSTLKDGLASVERLVREQALKAGYEGLAFGSARSSVRLDGGAVATALSSAGGGASSVAGSAFASSSAGQAGDASAVHPTSARPALRTFHSAEEAQTSAHELLPAGEPLSPSSVSSAPVGPSGGGHSHTGSDGASVVVDVTASSSGVGAAAMGEQETLADFVGRAQARLAKLASEEEAAREAFKSLLGYLGEDPAQTPEGCFSTISAFLSLMKKAYKEEVAENEQKARELRRQQSETLRRGGGAAGGGAATPGSSSSVWVTPGSGSGFGANATSNSAPADGASGGADAATPHRHINFDAMSPVTPPQPSSSSGVDAGTPRHPSSPVAAGTPRPPRPSPFGVSGSTELIGGARGALLAAITARGAAAAAAAAASAGGSSTVSTTSGRGGGGMAAMLASIKARGETNSSTHSDEGTPTARSNGAPSPATAAATATSDVTSAAALPPASGPRPARPVFTFGGSADGEGDDGGGNNALLAAIRARGGTPKAAPLTQPPIDNDVTAGSGQYLDNPSGDSSESATASSSGGGAAPPHPRMRSFAASAAEGSSSRSVTSPTSPGSGGILSPLARPREDAPLQNTPFYAAAPAPSTRPPAPVASSVPAASPPAAAFNPGSRPMMGPGLTSAGAPPRPQGPPRPPVPSAPAATSTRSSSEADAAGEGDSMSALMAAIRARKKPTPAASDEVERG